MLVSSCYPIPGGMHAMFGTIASSEIDLCHCPRGVNPTRLFVASS